MIKIQQAIIVEGKYDKIKVKSLFDTMVVETNGFGIFSDTEKQRYICMLSKKIGVIVLTDGDGAGFVIRNFIKNICKGGTLYNAYIPDVYGKERRKTSSSKEGKLGVEGLPAQIIIDGVTACLSSPQVGVPQETITMADLNQLGLSGRQNSREVRKKLANVLGLPEHLTSKAFLEVLNCLYTYDDILNFLADKPQENKENI